MKNEPMEKIGRLAMRQEGGNWVAYYAMPETMEKAICLGSIKMNIIIGHPERKATFMDLMRDCVADIIEDIVGTRPTMPGPVPAPEHEKSGSA